MKIKNVKKSYTEVAKIYDKNDSSTHYKTFIAIYQLLI